MKSTFIIFTIFLCIKDLFACKPPASFKSPTIKEIASKSEYIFEGKVLAQKKLGESKTSLGTLYKLEIEVTKKLKGNIPAKVEVTTTSHSCDFLGQYAVVNSECIIFAKVDLSTISGLFSGYASYCNLPNSPNLKKIIKDREEKIVN